VTAPHPGTLRAARRSRARKSPAVLTPSRRRVLRARVVNGSKTSTSSCRRAASFAPASPQPATILRKILRVSSNDAQVPAPYHRRLDTWSRSSRMSSPTVRTSSNSSARRPLVVRASSDIRVSNEIISPSLVGISANAPRHVVTPSAFSLLLQSILAEPQTSVQHLPGKALLPDAVFPRGQMVSCHITFMISAIVGSGKWSRRGITPATRVARLGSPTRHCWASQWRRSAKPRCRPWPAGEGEIRSTDISQPSDSRWSLTTGYAPPLIPDPDALTVRE